MAAGTGAGAAGGIGGAPVALSAQHEIGETAAVADEKEEQFAPRRPIHLPRHDAEVETDDAEVETDIDEDGADRSYRSRV